MAELDKGLLPSTPSLVPHILRHPAMLCSILECPEHSKLAEYFSPLHLWWLEQAGELKLWQQLLYAAPAHVTPGNSAPHVAHFQQDTKLKGVHFPTYEEPCAPSRNGCSSSASSAECLWVPGGKGQKLIKAFSYWTTSILRKNQTGE